MYFEIHITYSKKKRKTILFKNYIAIYTYVNINTYIHCDSIQNGPHEAPPPDILNSVCSLHIVPLLVHVTNIV